MKNKDDIIMFHLSLKDINTSIYQYGGSLRNVHTAGLQYNCFIYLDVVVCLFFGGVVLLMSLASINIKLSSNAD